MDPFSYVCVLTSIVAGLALTRLIGGLGQLLQTGKRTPTYWVHTLWMLNTLLGVIIVWWVQYRWRHIEHWTLFLVLWLLVAPIVLYLGTALLFPNEQEGEPITNWRTHYYASHRQFFLAFGLIFPLDLIDTALKGWDYFRSLGLEYCATQTALFALCLIAAFTKSPRFHGVFAVFFLVFNTVLLGSNLLRLM
ncbi:MAG: hypothetical protein ACJ8IQ_08100 [Chthoniobacterales bacterium]